MFWRGAAAASDDIQKAAVRELANDSCHFLCSLVIFTKLVWQTGVRMRGNEAGG